MHWLPLNNAPTLPSAAVFHSSLLNFVIRATQADQRPYLWARGMCEHAAAAVKHKITTFALLRFISGLRVFAGLRRAKCEFPAREAGFRPRLVGDIQTARKRKAKGSCAQMSRLKPV